MIQAVLFDLDDTLYPQLAWLDGAWAAVASAGRDLGLDEFAFLDRLRALCSEGSDRGRIIDRALERVGAPLQDPRPLIQAFQQYRAIQLEPYPGVREAVCELAQRVPLGLVSDGNPATQRAKLTALGFEDLFRAVVMSDELGREYRKPSARPFLAALTALGAPPENAVFVGDRPDKDVAGAQALGMRAIRVLTGEYRDTPDDPVAWHIAADVPQAVAIVCRHLHT